MIEEVGRLWSPSSPWASDEDERKRLLAAFVDFTETVKSTRETMYDDGSLKSFLTSQPASLQPYLLDVYRRCASDWLAPNSLRHLWVAEAIASVESSS